ncbi:MAG: Hpt domain-containing protein [Nitrospiraceae bacterium]
MTRQLTKKDALMDPSRSALNPAAQKKVIVHVDASFAPLVPRFMTNRKKEVSTMREALAAQDFDTVRKISHGMKGAGGSYGFDRITEMAAVIEQSAKTGAHDTIDRELTGLDSYLEHVDVIFDDEASEVS